MGKEKNGKLYRMRDLITMTQLHRRQCMYFVDVLKLQPVRQGRDGVRYFSEEQVQQIVERAGKGKNNDR